MASSLRLSMKAVVCLLGCVLAARAEEESGGAEEAIVNAENVGISVMLLGNVAFMMGLFYLVNHSDPLMRMYSWKVISATISIFAAVLIFQGVNGLIEEHLLEGATEEFELFVGMAHFLAWVALLQLTLAYICGAIGTPPKGAAALHQMELRAKCWGILLGHITGFAAINAFGVLQQQVPKKSGPLFLVPPAAWAVIRLLGAYTSRFRTAVAMGDDNKMDEAEEKWIEETEETEDDVIGLAVSFTVVQAVRWTITGVLPNPEGEEPEDVESSHADTQVYMLLGTGLGIALLEVLRNIWFTSQRRRLTKQLRNVVAMISAWLFFFSTEWWLSYHFSSMEGMMKEVVKALFVTTTALAAIFVLIKLAESDKTGEAADHAIKKTVDAMGFLIGFSWEKSFDVAVASLAKNESKHVPPDVTKLLLAFFLAALVVPAWRRYILPTILEYEEQEEEEEEQEAEGAKKAEEGEAAAAAPLAEPLLAVEKEKRQSIGGMDQATLKKKYKESKAKVAQLKDRNNSLESSLGVILSELWDLRRIADALRATPASPERPASPASPWAYQPPAPASAWRRP